MNPNTVGFVYLVVVLFVAVRGGLLVGVVNLRRGHSLLQLLLLSENEKRVDAPKTPIAIRLPRTAVRRVLSTTTAVVESQDVDRILDSDDNDERPEDERQDAEDVRTGQSDGMRSLKALPEGVERTRPDVPVALSLLATGRRPAAWEL